jgi:hypothetical protein
MQNMSDEGLEAYSHHLTKIMRFSAVVLGRALGLTVVQPFLHPQIVAFSIGLPKVRFYFDYALDVLTELMFSHSKLAWIQKEISAASWF